MKKAFAYIRTSTTDQLDKSGPDRQRRVIEGCAKHLKLEIVDYFTEDISGTTQCMKRPVFREMIHAVTFNGVDTIMVENLGRLARKVPVQTNVITFLAVKGIGLISADSCADITDQFHSDPNQKAMIQMMAVMFEWEKDIIVARLQAGRTITGRKGGRPPVYSEDLKARIRDLRRRGSSYGEIVKVFHGEGVKSNREDGTWSPQLVRMVGMKGKGKRGKQ